MKRDEPFVRKPLDLGAARVPRGRVHIIPGRCKGCGYCIEFCPHDVLTESADINAKGYHYAVVKKGKGYECVHCRFCDLVCPEMAIYTEEMEEEASSERGTSEG